MLLEKSENPNGLHRRYDVRYADGTQTDPRAAYFVLRLDGLGDDAAHIAACRVAARAYAAFVKAEGIEHLDRMAAELERLVEHFDAGHV